jgi:hypothetical protein
VATETQSAKDDRTSFGVLLVHGAGDHRRAGVVNGFGEPIYLFLKRWLASVPDVDLRGGKVEIASALTMRSEGGPAHVRLDISIPRPGKDPVQQRWIFAESLWDAAISPPGFWNVLIWAITLGPWLIVTQVWGPVAERYRVLKNDPTPSDFSILFDYRLLVTAFIGLAVTVIGAAVMTIAGLGLAIVSILPIERIRGAVGSIQRWVSLGAGDLYVMLVRPFERAAMIAQVRDDLEWLRSQDCQGIAVLAHSQGGAVAHAALSGKKQLGVRLLYTFGSGATRLREAERMITTRGRAVFALILVIGLLLLWFVVGRHVPTCGLDPICYLSAFDLGSAWMFLAIGSFGALAGSLLLDVIGADTTVPPPAGGIRWCDALASHDPVLNTRHGRSLPKETRQFEVQNRASFVSDHSAYWRNTDQFVADVTFELAEAFGSDLRHLGPTGSPSYWIAVRRRRWRVWLLKHARTALLLGAIAGLATSWPRIQERGAEALDMAKGAAGMLPAPLDGVVSPLVPAQSWYPMAGAALHLLALFVLLKSFGFAWGLWDQHEIAALYRRSPLKSGAAPVVTLATLGLLMAVVAGAWMTPTISDDLNFTAGLLHWLLTFETWWSALIAFGTLVFALLIVSWIVTRLYARLPGGLRSRLDGATRAATASLKNQWAQRPTRSFIDLEANPGLPDPSRSLVAAVLAVGAGAVSFYLFTQGIGKVIDAGGNVDLLGLNAFVLSMAALLLGFLVLVAGRGAVVRFVGIVAMVASLAGCVSVFLR